MTDVKSAPVQRLHQLDSIRGIAALFVVCDHYVFQYGMPGNLRWLAWPLLSFWWDGLAAVSMFFVLSGLVLSLRYFRHPGSPPLERFSLLAYAIARLCRVWLPFVVVVLLSAAAFRFSGLALQTSPPADSWAGHYWHVAPTFGSILQECWLPGRYAHVLLPQGWSLTIELILSLAVPVAILIVARNRLWLLLLTVVLSRYAGLSLFAVHFALGVLLARDFTLLTAWLRQRPRIRIITLLAGALLYAGRPGGAGRLLAPTLSPLIWWMMAVGSALLLLGASSSATLVRLLSKPLIHHVGRISYSIYLCHFAVLCVVTPRAIQLLDRLMPSAAGVGGLVLTLVVSVLVADPLYRLVESPTMALGRRLSAMVYDQRVRP